MTRSVNELINQFINDEPVYRTAPATPGLLNMEVIICIRFKYGYCKLKEHCQKQHINIMCSDIEHCVNKDCVMRHKTQEHKAWSQTIHSKKNLVRDSSGFCLRLDLERKKRQKSQDSNRKIKGRMEKSTKENVNNKIHDKKRNN